MIVNSGGTRASWKIEMANGLLFIGRHDTHGRVYVNEIYGGTKITWQVKRSELN